MKTILGCTLLTLAIASTAIPADAKGCIKGADTMLVTMACWERQ
jgi:hypothetical protein